MSPVEAVGSVFSNYFNFSGRAARSEYWWWVGAWLLGYFIALVLFLTVDFVAGITALGLYWLVTFIPNLAVVVRRLHDTGRTGWWLLIALIPFGSLVLLIFMVMDTEPAMNRWGPPAKGSRYADQGWGAAPAVVPGTWQGATSDGTGGATGSANSRTKIFSGATTDAAEAAYRADLGAAAAAGYQAVGQRWDTTQSQPTLVVDYEPVPPPR
jgi:uncharacterized membrane protein YhaH (DUF805 family)